MFDFEKLQREFADPPAEWRPAPFWSWNDRLEEAELLRQIEHFREAGMGGFFMHSREGLETPYLSEEWMRLIRACVERARERGLSAWLYDEDKWPSGFAGGAVANLGPEYRQRWLVRHCEGEPFPQGERGRAAARLLAESRREGGVAERFYELPDTESRAWFNGATYPDLANPRVTAAFLRLTHEAYRRALGEEFGRAIPGVFTDEPCYAHMLWAPPGALPWTQDLPEHFEARKGYSLIGALSALFTPEPGYRKVRFDFFDTLTERFLEGFTRPYARWTGKAGLIFTGHFMAEDSLTDQARWIGAAMPHYEFMDWPGLDHLGRHTGLALTHKQAASAASQLGKARVLAETFGASGQNLSLEDQKWIVNFHVAMGVNFINPHLSAYSLRGARKRDYPPNLFFQQPWWPYERALSDYAARLCRLLSLGRRVAPLLLLNPAASAWAEYAPLPEARGARRAQAPGEIHRRMERVADTLLRAGWDFELGDETLLARHGHAAQGRLAIGRQEYPIVLVAAGHVWRRSTLERLQAAREAGVAVIRLPGPVWLEEGAPSPLARRVWREIPAIPFPRLVNTIATLRDPAAAPPPFARLAPCQTSAGKPPRLLFHRRHEGNTEILFVANDDRRRAVTVQIQTPGRAIPTRWDPETGGVSAPPFTWTGEHTQLIHELPPAGSLLLTLCPAAQMDAAGGGSHSAAPARAPARTSPPLRLALALRGAWRIRRLDPNALTLDLCRFSINGAPLSAPTPVYEAARRIRETSRGGDSFSTEFTFQIAEGARPDLMNRAELVIETPERYSIHVNAKTLDRKARGRGAWLDASWKRFALEGLAHPGENRILLQSRCGCPPDAPEIEPLFLLGDFAVRRAKKHNRKFATRQRSRESALTPDAHSPQENLGGFLLADEPGMARGGDLTREGYPFFAGRLRLLRHFDFHPAPRRRYFLDLARWDTIHGRAWINGQELAPFPWRPWRREITGALRQGANSLELEIATSLQNLLGPHLPRAARLAWVSPEMWTCAASPQDMTVFVPVGVSGVKILESAG